MCTQSGRTLSWLTTGTTHNSPFSWYEGTSASSNSDRDNSNTTVLFFCLTLFLLSLCLPHKHTLCLYDHGNLLVWDLRTSRADGNFWYNLIQTKVVLISSYSKHSHTYCHIFSFTVHHTFMLISSWLTCVSMTHDLTLQLSEVLLSFYSCSEGGSIAHYFGNVWNG